MTLRSAAIASLGCSSTFTLTLPAGAGALPTTCRSRRLARIRLPRTSTSAARAAAVLLALLRRLLAGALARFGRCERFALARGEPLLVLERSHVPVDLGEMLGELRFPCAQLLARRGDDRRRQAEARGDLE